MAPSPSGTLHSLLSSLSSLSILLQHISTFTHTPSLSLSPFFTLSLCLSLSLTGFNGPLSPGMKFFAQRPRARAIDLHELNAQVFSQGSHT